MTLQYIADSFGETKAVQLQIPIERWREIREKYSEFAAVQNAADDEDFEIPEWHKELVLAEVEKIKNGTADLMSWDDFRKELGV